MRNSELANCEPKEVGYTNTDCSRPNNLSEVTAQDHAVSVLKRGLESSNVSVDFALLSIRAVLSKKKLFDQYRLKDLKN